MPSELVPPELLELRVREGIAEGLNLIAQEIYEQSQIEVPKGTVDKNRNGETLQESGRGPANDPEHAATPEKLWAAVSYDTPYARAQHEGMAIDEREGGPVNWHVENYTTPGTKKKYLEDPLKSATPRLEPTVKATIASRLNG